MDEMNLTGQTVMGYRVEQKLGAGAFGTVYKVSKNEQWGNFTRALKHIKVPSEKQYNDVLNAMGGDYAKADKYFSKSLQSIVDEIKVMNSLTETDTANIVRYYEYDIKEIKSPKRYDVYILMEYLTPFARYIETVDFSVHDVIKLGLDILEGIKICHENGIMHRDIKPDNIFVSKDKRFKIGDFGISKVLNEKSRAASIKGTPNYLAPEVYLGQEGYTNSVDLYAIGIVLYKLLNYLRNPFLPSYPAVYDMNDEDEAFEKRMQGGIPSIPMTGGEELGAAVVKAISEKTKRYQSAEEFMAALQKAEDEMSSQQLSQVVNHKKSGYDCSGDAAKEDRTALLLSGENQKTDEAGGREESREETVLLKFEAEIRENTAGIKEDVIKPEGSLQKESEEFLELAPEIMDKFVFTIPFILSSVILIVYFLIVPNTFGVSFAFFEWFLREPDRLCAFVHNYNPQITIYGIITLRIILYVLLAGLFLSILVVGLRFHKQKNNEQK